MKDKVTLITGASRGIGRAIALLFARAGSDIVVNYLSNEAAALAVVEEVEKSGVQGMAARANAADRSQVENMVANTISRFGRIDVLVNNAGIWERNPIDGMSDVRLRAAIDTNIYGTYYPIMAVVPHMKRRGAGAIVNISSTAGQRGEAFHSPYATSKGAVIALTKSLGAELATDNIRVNCVAPGWVVTDMSREALDGEMGETYLSKIPLGRAASPEELAGPVLFLASDMASFIIGETLNVNGGAVMAG